MMTKGYKLDPAAEFLAQHGESFERGDVMKVKHNATDLAESPAQIKGATKGRRGGGIDLKKVAEVLSAHGLDPTEEIVKVLPSLDASLKSRVLLELLNYCQPKLKAVELTGPDGGPVQHAGTFNINFKGRGD